MKLKFLFLENPFARRDQDEDEIFYHSPRYMSYLDLPARKELEKFYGKMLPAGGKILDLMSGFHSHLPEDISFKEVIGLGLNEDELKQNTHLTNYVIHNVNRDPRLPFADGYFDACTLSLSVQYLVRPIEVFAEVARVLKSNGCFLIGFSDLIFPTKSVLIWHSKNAIERSKLIKSYIYSTHLFSNINFVYLSPVHKVSDLIYAVSAYRKDSANSVVKKINYSFSRRKFFPTIGMTIGLILLMFRKLIAKDIEERIIDIIAKQCRVSKDKIKNKTRIKDLGADSYDCVVLASVYEKEFSINIPDEDANNIKTVQDAISYIKQKIKDTQATQQKKN